MGGLGARLVTVFLDSNLEAVRDVTLLQKPLLQRLGAFLTHKMVSLSLSISQDLPRGGYLATRSVAEGFIEYLSSHTQRWSKETKSLVSMLHDSHLVALLIHHVAKPGDGVDVISAGFSHDVDTFAENKKLGTQAHKLLCRVVEPPVQGLVPAISESLIGIFKSHTTRDPASQ
jgi:PhoPQ-activated pathogenicity-related protein